LSLPAAQIRMQNVEENLNSAMENLPESFARVTMLYVHLQINGKPVSIPVLLTVAVAVCAYSLLHTHLHSYAAKFAHIWRYPITSNSSGLPAAAACR
jgi:hypothetical protein